MKTIPIVVPNFEKSIETLPDLLDSLKTYIRHPYKVIIVDDFSRDGAYERLLELEKNEKNIKVIRSQINRGWGYGLWVSVGIGIKWALENLDFDFCLRIDCDGLLIKHGLDDLLAKLYTQRKIGFAGHLQVQNNHFWFWHLRLARKWKEKAKRNGYFKRQDTENSFWFPQEGLMSFGHDLVKTIAENNLFEDKNDLYKKLLGTKGLFDGPLWAILCYAYGFDAVDVPIIRSYFNLDWLTKIPHEIFANMGICAIHPLKRSANPNSQDAKIRLYFQEIRNKEKAENVY